MATSSNMHQNSRGTYSVDPKTGTVTYIGECILTSGDHSNMPARTPAYPEGYERGHGHGSSVGGVNDRLNITPQAADVNHHGYASMEAGEREVLKAGGQVETEKSSVFTHKGCYVPETYQVNDTITYPTGKTQEVHLSFANLSYAEQETYAREVEAQASGMSDAWPNPGDALREEMTPAEYAKVIEETESFLPGIKDLYSPDWVTVEHSDTPQAEWTADLTEDGASPDTDVFGKVEVEEPDI